MDIKKWLSRKHRRCHITLRDIDIPDFDVEQLMAILQISISIPPLSLLVVILPPTPANSAGSDSARVSMAVISLANY